MLAHGQRYLAASLSVGRRICTPNRSCDHDTYATEVNHYEVLGIAPNASHAEIRRAFVSAARRHHPDFHAGADPTSRRAAEASMRAVNDAWAVLSDPRRRDEYNDHLAALRRAGARDAQAADRAHAVRRTSSGASIHFRPLDNEPDPDPWLLDDRPYAGSRPPPAWMQVLPVALLLFGLGATIVGLFVGLRPVAGLGLVVVALATVAFLLAPFYVMGQNRHSRR